ncbi:MAG: hypothetical protein A3E31_18380 [Candidatus Rokubacteria bacterium RIFCSPHIGHO2_12_FULL_73_22]|nr:MAG: hypothetical protein A3D33_15445 [Candidatus Rokubacteria bacterium RIFCSPHIGHO2_02_FULL_73_26]OGK99471.1 MAG: hypothetical protein A3E31_18380 [Candidatus Rokubacteria bacterium RIFCSPHIGHO2_12_FULL_73_22]OGL13431.1 MAG: hypothetical protein A3I14_18330 [Candidatus Rokubacteria bacterium RIFCSPLOWO2_02_FULL_73_56]OGL27375.1 MAG: hypothetical protein A3G44_14360 [Candidatus Rokubacteria bacterium RIFCSPLOWO2_12_FULL_73_47]
MRRRRRHTVPTKLRAAFGRRLRELRRGRALSQERLGARAQLSGKFLGELERGEKSPTLDTMARLARALGVTLARMVTDQGRVDE